MDARGGLSPLTAIDIGDLHFLPPSHYKFDCVIQTGNAPPHRLIAATISTAPVFPLMAVYYDPD